MTTTDILQHLQDCVGLSIKLNKIALGKALKEAGFERLIKRTEKHPSYGYFVAKL